jgi:hypothetical protein
MMTWRLRVKEQPASRGKFAAKTEPVYIASPPAYSFMKGNL